MECDRTQMQWPVWCTYRKKEPQQQQKIGFHLHVAAVESRVAALGVKISRIEGLEHTKKAKSAMRGRPKKTKKKETGWLHCWCR